ncbi:hypothetical protein TNCV_831731 [Trichonephila clavipes]|nr:hypothetical protein TNCV_831731 [Trichonephila clavipes]
MDLCAFGLLNQALEKRHRRTLNGLWKMVQEEGWKVLSDFRGYVRVFWQNPRANTQLSAQHLDHYPNARRKYVRKKNAAQCITYGDQLREILGMIVQKQG